MTKKHDVLEGSRKPPKLEKCGPKRFCNRGMEAKSRLFSPNLPAGGVGGVQPINQKSNAGYLTRPWAVGPAN